MGLHVALLQRSPGIRTLRASGVARLPAGPRAHGPQAERPQDAGRRWGAGCALPSRLEPWRGGARPPRGRVASSRASSILGSSTPSRAAGLRKPHQPARQAKEGGVAWRPGVSWGLSDPPPWRRTGGTRGSGRAVRAGAPHGQQHSRVSMLSGASPGPCRDPSSCQHPFRS